MVLVIVKCTLFTLLTKQVMFRPHMVLVIARCILFTFLTKTILATLVGLATLKIRSLERPTPTLGGGVCFMTFIHISNRLAVLAK